MKGHGLSPERVLYICVLYVFCMCSVCALYVFCICSVCVLYVFCMLSVRASMNIGSILTCNSA